MIAAQRPRVIPYFVAFHTRHRQVIWQRSISHAEYCRKAAIFGRLAWHRRPSSMKWPEFCMGFAEIAAHTAWQEPL